MSCGSCASGGCGTGSKPAGCNSNGSCETGSCGKLDVFDWLSGMDLYSVNAERTVEVRFKNTRKEFYRYNAELQPSVGDSVVVESTSGYDIGMVSLTGELVPIQMKKKGVKSSNGLLYVKRLATQEDIDKWNQFREKENDSMIKARKVSKDLKLEMKISDVEFQADGTKATFFYTSEGRVDFRELIKKFASTFKVRVEMKQIGTRQEAGRLGGIGSCGRELCCSSWLTDFRSVSTSAARYQQLAINPIKLAGQCGKLKCCLNYELDSYMDALKDFPKGDVKLYTRKGMAFMQKTDIFKRVMWFSYADEPSVFHPMTLERVHEIIAMNLDKKKPDDLKDFAMEPVIIEKEPDYENVVGQDDLNRFDSGNKRPKKGNRKPQNKKRPNSNSNNPNQALKTGAKGPVKKQNPNQKNNPKAKNQPNRAKNPNQNKPGNSQNLKKKNPNRKPNPNANRNKKPNSPSQENKTES